MELCGGSRQNRHDEVCIQDSVGCPACAALDEVRDLEEKVSELEKELANKE